VNIKQDFESVDPQWVLQQLVETPVSAWSYKEDPARTRHIGPMAQDFRAAFGVGESERYIFQVDADGVSFAAIQALNARVEELDGENRKLRETVESLEARLASAEPATAGVHTCLIRG
jgi:hypothetical protein